MGKLHELLAVEGSHKSQVDKITTEAKETFSGRNAAYSGFSKTYEPLRSEDPVRHPAENKVVGYTALEKLKYVSQAYANLFDCQFQKECGNQKARADIVITVDDGAETETILAREVPATMLLSMETRLEELRKAIEGCPTLDPNLQWEWSQTEGCWTSKEIKKTSTRKQPKVIVKYEATKEHPAQTELFSEDLPVGTWTEVQKSGALSVPQKAAFFRKLDMVQRAVKRARMRANDTEVENKKIAKGIFDYLTNI